MAFCSAPFHKPKTRLAPRKCHINFATTNLFSDKAKTEELNKLSTKMLMPFLYMQSNFLGKEI
jgi:hypothetical protein